MRHTVLMSMRNLGELKSKMFTLDTGTQTKVTGLGNLLLINKQLQFTPICAFTL